MPLYSIQQSQASQIRKIRFAKERELQALFEENLETLLGVRFVASEYVTGNRQRGRIDTLGLDLDGTPTIIEYKRDSKDNIINQGLFYLDWLVDHRGDFTLAAQNALGTEIEIDWSQPRLILIAESFSEYDAYAVNRIGANIELWTFRRYDNDLLLLETEFATNPASKKIKTPKADPAQSETGQPETTDQDQVITYTLDHHLGNKSEDITQLYNDLVDGILRFSDSEDLVWQPHKTYIGFRHGKNFCQIKPQKQRLKIWIDISPDDLNDPQELGRDMRKVGHYGTGDVEIHLAASDQIPYVLGLIEQAYQLTV